MEGHSRALPLLIFSSLLYSLLSLTELIQLQGSKYHLFIYSPQILPAAKIPLFEHPTLYLTAFLTALLGFHLTNSNNGHNLFLTQFSYLEGTISPQLFTSLMQESFLISFPSILMWNDSVVTHYGLPYISLIHLFPLFTLTTLVSILFSLAWDMAVVS